MTTILGIDPGIKGGWAVINGPKLLYWGRIPTMKIRSKTVIDCATWFDQVPTVKEAVLELVGAWPGQGRSSAFQFGHSTGSCNAMAMLKSKGVTYVTPQTWKTRHFKLEKDKSAALEQADAFWPNTVRWDVLANDGIAEAALMAQWRLDTKGKKV